MKARKQMPPLTIPLARNVFALVFALSFALESLAADTLTKKTPPLSPHPASSSVRLISTAPSNTELIYSLNAGHEVVGVSESCNFPGDVQGKPKISSFNSLKMEKIAQLKPSCIFLVSGQESMANSLSKHGFNARILDNSSIQNIGKNLLAIGKVIKQENEANRLAVLFKTSLSSLEKLTQADPHKPRVFVCVWPQPLMSAGKNSFINEGVTIAGGINCTGDIAQPYPRINPEKLLLLKPDLIVVPAEQAREKFWDKSPWTSMKAVQENHLYVLPQHETDCLTRPTLRYIDALYWLALKLHPKMKAEIDKWHAEAASSLNVNSER